MKPLKIVTFIGTRPEIIKLALVIKKLDALPNVDHILVHTGQNWAKNMKDVFFKDLGLREPDHYLGVAADTLGKQIANIIEKSEEILKQENPDLYLVLGDTNSALSSIVAARMGIPILHMEAGNRSFDRRVPEEQNRRMIDHISTWLFPYREAPRENLLNEGINPSKIFVTGDPYIEVLRAFAPKANTNILEKVGVQSKNYFLATTHREENVEDLTALQNIAQGLAKVAEKYRDPVIWSLHPRTLEKIKNLGIILPQSVRVMEAMGLMDFLTLEKNAKCLISDSGTVPQEGAVFKVPSVVIRKAMERPEVLEAGATLLTGVDSPDEILRAVDTMLAMPANWVDLYQDEGSPSDRMIKFIMGYKEKVY
ncbi:MAG: UDP-N-acetylglucosamine 2-epimerase (non-hydrolyzing) [Patescibacteria group bacterium]|nr:UDP-N-acetylglucosamine 2-epimerase (non-hydrolyzing) [Patescibacteria group bacterium]